MSNNEGQGRTPGWLDRIMATNLIGPDDLQAIVAGDFSPMRRILPQLMADPEFMEIPEIRNLAARLAPQAAEATRAAPAAIGSDRREPAVQGQPEATGVAPFADVGDEFGRRVCGLLASDKFAGEIQINMEITARGVVFQALQHVVGEDGKTRVVPFTDPVKSAPAQLGRWVKIALREIHQRLLTMREDEAMLDEGDEGDTFEAPPEPARRRRNPQD